MEGKGKGLRPGALPCGVWCSICNIGVTLPSAWGGEHKTELRVFDDFTAPPRKESIKIGSGVFSYIYIYLGPRKQSLGPSSSIAIRGAAVPGAGEVR